MPTSLIFKKVLSMNSVHIETAYFFFFQAEDGIRDYKVTGVQTCALPIYRRPERRRARRDDEAGGPHDLGLLRRRVADRGDDRAGVPHAAALGSGEPGHVADHRLRHVLLHEYGGVRFLRPADLADHHDRFGLRVLLEQGQHIDERAAVDRIAADADAGRDADVERLHLGRRLVAQRAGARDHADRAAGVDVAWHDPHHRPARTDHPGAVRPDQRGAPFLRVAPQVPLHGHHVLGGDAVRDGHDQPDPRVRGFHDGVGAERRGDEDEARHGSRVRHRFLRGVEHGPAEMGGAALPGRDAAHDVGAVRDHFLRVERPLVAREALDDDVGLLVEQDTHVAPTRAASRAATTRSAASDSVSAVRISSPLSFRIRRPSSTLVPASRTTSGTGTRTSRTAWTTPCATQSQRLIPANTFTRIALTLRSESTSRNAAATRSGPAPPPMSRKFASSPPACLIMSIVTIAIPAPLMMQPMSPSRATYLSPCSAAAASRGSSWAESRSSATLGRRNMALSSKLIFTSRASTCRSLVTTSFDDNAMFRRPNVAELRDSAQ